MTPEEKEKVTEQLRQMYHTGQQTMKGNITDACEFYVNASINAIEAQLAHKSRPDREELAKKLFYYDLKTSTWAEAMLAWGLAENDRQEEYYQRADQILALFNEEEIRKDERERIT